MGFEDKLARVAILFQISVHPRSHGQIIDVAYCLLGDDRRSERTERVHRFGQEELAAVALRFLPVTRRYVLRHCVTEDAILDVTVGDGLALLADHYRQLGLPVHFLQMKKLCDYSDAHR